MQIRTVEELLAGKGFDRPLRPVQFQQAQRVKRKEGVQGQMLQGGRVH